ncbi:hypothetical protein OVS_00610 [Mycoplasma ovis str. Michigan]|uniref:Uncharacterized protein n=1 Tax=Mycoplasma ovis str. Michigan TaxID=1415773 RepID=A0ABM5P1E7_9MOLU|nr:hypothetical protein [Mycoplasma ovis]AHC40112.1 hypothetical protein OVS_00610 [Mycoplasma ovis str. Michigan]
MFQVIKDLSNLLITLPQQKCINFYKIKGPVLPPPTLLTAIGDSVDEDSSIGHEVKVNVQQKSFKMLGVRNEDFMGISKEKIGSIWTGDKTGGIYKDGFFYVPENFEWLKGIPDAGQVKSLVSGIGMKVVKNSGKAISFDNKPSKWRDALSCNKWVESHGKKKCLIEKEIEVQRVAYLEREGKQYELGENICMLRIDGNNNKTGRNGYAVYLMVGLVEVNVNENRGNGKDWEWKDESWLKNLRSCDLLKKTGWKQLKLKVEKHGISGDKGVSPDSWIMVFWGGIRAMGLQI